MSASADRNRSTAKDVDEYLAAIPAEARAALQHLRETIWGAAPEAEETIRCGMPAYLYHGPLIYFGAFANHLSLFGAGRSNLEALGDELAGYEIAGTTIRFSAHHPLPAELVERIVRMRVQENEVRAKRRQMSGGPSGRS